MNRASASCWSFCLRRLLLSVSALGVLHSPALAEAWLPEPLQIVATTTEQAARLAPPWQAAGFRVQSATPAEFRAAGPGGYWWVTADAADALGPDAIQARVKTGGKILLDGPGKASTALLGLRPTGISGRQAQMSGVSLAWDSDVAGLRPSVAGTVLASTVLAGTTATATGQGSPALFQAGALMWSLPPSRSGAGGAAAAVPAAGAALLSSLSCAYLSYFLSPVAFPSMWTCASFASRNSPQGRKKCNIG